MDIVQRKSLQFSYGGTLNSSFDSEDKMICLDLATSEHCLLKCHKIKERTLGELD